MPLRIGILLDSLSVPQWVSELINHIKADPNLELCLLIVNKSNQQHSRSAFMYRILRNFDKRFMQRGKDPFKRVKPDWSNIPQIEVNPIQKKFSDYFPDGAMAQIKSHNPDVLLRFGFRILRGKILSAAPHGILSLHHGDTAAFRGGPPAFWEVVQRSPVTGVTLQVLTETLDAGFILAKSFIRTDTTSFYRNQQKLYWAGLELFKEQLTQLSRKGTENYFESKRLLYAGEPKGHLYKNPGNLKSIQIFIQYLLRTVSRQLHAAYFIEQWQINILQSEKPMMQQNASHNITLLPPKDRIWADPFLIYKEDTYFLFLEEKKFSEKQGHISMIRLNAAGVLIDDKPVPVLKEKFHLSYPFIFLYQDRYYMIPEIAEAKKVILYESSRFPYDWKPVRTLLEGAYYYDSTLHSHTDGLWYLFCTQKSSSCLSSDAYLHIYFSEDPVRGKWEAHPMNPVYADIRGSRPAGALFIHEGKLIRPAQCGAPRYGNGIYYYQINELTKEVFMEEMIGQSFPEENSRVLSMHTINHTRSLQVIDQQIKRLNFF